MKPPANDNSDRATALAHALLNEWDAEREEIDSFLWRRFPNETMKVFDEACALLDAAIERRRQHREQARRGLFARIKPRLEVVR